MILRPNGPALIAVVCIGTIASAQLESPQLRFRTGVDIVRLDVSALDRNRRPVRGLTAEDFTVLESGKPQPIVAFSAVEVPDASGPSEGWQREVPSDVATNQLDVQRIVIIVMDDGMTVSDPGAAKIGRQIARAVIDRLGSNDLAAVVFTFQGRSQNFTRDRRQLIAAAETFIPKSCAEPGPFTAESGRNPLATPGTTRNNPAKPCGPPLGCSYSEGTNCLTKTMKAVAAALEDTPIGRKSVVLISSGVNEKLEIGPGVDELQETLLSLQHANVNVYPFDPTGLTAEGMIGPRFDSLRVFADATGGRTTIATNAPWEQVPQVFVENGSYYLIGIRPPNGAEGARFRRLTVRVRRPDVEVRTRAGYYAPRAIRPRPGRTAGPATPLDKAFGASVPSGTLPLDVTAAPFALPDRKESALAITVGVRRPVTDRVSVEKIEVRAAAFDGDFRQRASHRQTGELTLRPNASGERRVEMQSRLTLRPGRYEVRVAAEAQQDAGGVFLRIDIPDFRKSRLSMSGLVFGRPRNGASDVLADLIPVLPTATRVLSPAVPVTAFLRVYQGGRDAPRSVRMRARIVDAAGRPVFEETRELSAGLFGASRAAEFRLELPLARLSAGPYLLTVEATDAKAAERREVRFAVDGA